jgi:hypothetical protein
MARVAVRRPGRRPVRAAAKYCTPADGGIDVAAEQALRCLAAYPDSPPAFVQAWSKDVFGLDAKDLRSAVP